MSHRTLNLGIVAHVDAGKTTLTERLLHAAGVIDRIGSVDAGTTQTDSLELERRRGITIRSAVVSFPLNGVTVNLIDTPGHPDFIAEVERALSVLDGAILVISAVEGVQPQTRVLLRALQRLRVPTLLFVNKIDRSGADPHRVLAAVSRRLTDAIIPLGTVDRPGTRAARFRPHGQDDPGFRDRLAELLADRNDVLLKTYVEDPAAVTYPRLRAELAHQTQQMLVHPVCFGSAVTGAGVEPLLASLTELLPATAGDPDGPVSGQVFKIERGPTGDRVAYVRMFSGTVRTRDRVSLGAGAEAKVTAVRVFERGTRTRPGPVQAGEIAKLWGLSESRVGDPVGVPHRPAAKHHFDPPTLAAVVESQDPAQKWPLRAALTQLSEQDPLINVRQDGADGITVSLYGEVQKEVLEATLAQEYGVTVVFRETTIVCVERPAGSGEAVEVLSAESNPFPATIGLRVDPAPPGSGVEFRLRVDFRTVPLYLSGTMDGFAELIGDCVRTTLREGLYGWQVTDCVVTMIRCAYRSADGPPSTRGALSTPNDYRGLTPMVLARALRRAGTVVCEPAADLTLEVPIGDLSAVLAMLAKLGGVVWGQAPRGELFVVEAALATARVRQLRQRLPGLTGGEGALESRFGGYQPVTGDPPTRPRTTADPLNRNAYLTSLSRQGQRG